MVRGSAMDQDAYSRDLAAIVPASAREGMKSTPNQHLTGEAEPRRSRGLRRAAGALAVLGVGWFAGQNTQLVAVTPIKSWVEQSANTAFLSLASVQKEVMNRFHSGDAPVL